jgi:hypothetical protein
MRVLAKLLQLLLIWLAAIMSIVAGTIGGHAIGFLSHRPGRRVLAWTVLSGALVFAAALVQRAPAAVSALVVLSALLGAFGLWLLIDDAPAAGLVYLAIGAVYLGGLGPACYRWLTDRGA